MTESPLTSRILYIMHCAHLIQPPPRAKKTNKQKQIMTSDAEQDVIEGIGWSITPMETVTVLGVRWWSREAGMQ